MFDGVSSCVFSKSGFNESVFLGSIFRKITYENHLSNVLLKNIVSNFSIFKKSFSKFYQISNFSLKTL